MRKHGADGFSLIYQSFPAHALDRDGDTDHSPFLVDLPWDEPRRVRGKKSKQQRQELDESFKEEWL